MAEHLVEAIGDYNSWDIAVHDQQIVKTAIPYESNEYQQLALVQLMLYCLDNINGNMFSDITSIPYLSVNKPIFATLTPLEIYQGAPKLLSILKSGPAIMIPPNIVVSL